MASGRSSSGRALRVLLVTLVLLIVGFVGLIRFAYRAPAPGREVSIDRLYAHADRGQILSAKLLDENAVVVAVRCVPAVGENPLASQPPPDPSVSAGPVRCEGPREALHVAYPRSDVATAQLIERLSRGGATVVVDKQVDISVAKLVIAFVFPLALLANLFGIIFLSRGADGGISEIAGFGRIGRKRQRRRRLSTGTTFANVAGADEAVAELQEVVDYLRDPAKFKAFGAAVPKGVLLFGPPGCGKTLLARAVAGETGVPFFSASGTEFVESLVGVGAARVRDLFRQVREVAPAIVFIDEIDAVGRRRSGEGTSGGEREQTLNQLLVEMDGFEVTKGIVVMGATNRPDILDPGLLRPGRFDRHVTMDSPDLHGRRAILELHANGRPLAADVSFDTLARRTPGFTGADLANVINEAALLAIREGRSARIEMAHLSEAVQRVFHGPRRRGRLLTEAERRRLAYHEAGHAVIATALGHQGDLHRVSIVARGRGLGQSVLSSDRDRALLARSEMEAELTMTLAGIAAEELVCGESSTTAARDLSAANEIARRMAGHYGMSAELGLLRVLGNGPDGFPGGDAASLDPVSGQTLQTFDAEVKRLLERSRQGALAILGANREALDAVASALEAQETLEGEALASRLAGVVAGGAVLGDGAPAGAQPGGGPARRGRAASPVRKAGAP